MYAWKIINNDEQLYLSIEIKVIEVSLIQNAVFEDELLHWHLPYLIAPFLHHILANQRSFNARFILAWSYHHNCPYHPAFTLRIDFQHGGIMAEFLIRD